MKKSVIAGLLLLTLFISASFVSAGWWNDLFVNKNSISGNVVSDEGLVHEWNFDNDLKDSTEKVNLAASRRIKYVKTNSGSAVKLEGQTLTGSERNFARPDNEFSLAFCGKIDKISRLGSPFLRKLDTVRGSKEGFAFRISNSKELEAYALGGDHSINRPREREWVSCNTNTIDSEWHSIIITAKRSSTDRPFVYDINQGLYVDGFLCNNIINRQSRWLNNPKFLIKYYYGLIEVISIYHSILTEDNIRELSDDCLKNN